MLCVRDSVDNLLPFLIQCECHSGREFSQVSYKKSVLSLIYCSEAQECGKQEMEAECFSETLVTMCKCCI
jgi:hypothetical protein